MGDPSGYDPKAFRDLEQEGWGEVSDTYHDTFGNLTGQTVNALVDAAGIGVEGLLLDLACGTGRAAMRATQSGAGVVGLDFVATMVAEARHNAPGAAFCIGDAQHLPFASSCFGGVISNFGVRHFPVPQLALTEICRVLKEGGQFAITDWISPGALGPLVREAVAEHGARDAFKPPPGPEADFSDPASCRELLTAGGFIGIESREVAVTGRWPSPEGILATIYTGMVNSRASLEVQPPEHRIRVERAIVEKARRFEEDGEIRIPSKALLTTARKPAQ